MWRKVQLSQRGITLFELLTVLGLITLIVLIATPQMYRWYQNYRIKTTISQMAVHVRFARNAAVKQKIPYRVRFTAPSAYRIEYDPPGSSWISVPGYGNCTGTDCPIQLPTMVTIAANAEVEFNYRGGASASTSVQINGPNASVYQIDVSKAGGVTTTKIAEGD